MLDAYLVWQILPEPCTLGCILAGGEAGWESQSRAVPGPGAPGDGQAFHSGAGVARLLCLAGAPDVPWWSQGQDIQVYQGPALSSSEP